MIIGQTLETEVTAYTPWLPRRGDAATFLVDVIGIQSSNCQLTVTIQHKNLDEADSSATTAGTFSVATSTGIKTKRVSGLKELVRLKYFMTLGSPGNPEWIHLRMLVPSWETN